jgi:hypothetical protein
MDATWQHEAMGDPSPGIDIPFRPALESPADFTADDCPAWCFDDSLTVSWTEVCKTVTQAVKFNTTPLRPS